MGAAAYNRGTLALARRLDAAMPSAALRWYRDLSDYSQARGGTAPFRPTVVRRDPRTGEWCLMSRRDRGWGEFAYGYASIWKLFAAWRLAVVGDGRDAAGFFIEVIPATKE